MGEFHAAYGHCPLDGESDEIRILRLAPGKWNDPIKCEFRKVQLSADPKYAALSYVWGSQKDQQTILLDSDDFSVGQNLFIGLKRLRTHYLEPLDIWVDAICINQKSTSEKKSQVARMDQIYSQCQEVFIWLGDMSTHGSFEGILPLKKMLWDLETPPFENVDAAPLKFLGESSDLDEPLTEYVTLLTAESSKLESQQPKSQQLQVLISKANPAMSYRRIEEDCAWIIRLLAENKHIRDINILDGIDNTDFVRCHWHRLSTGLWWLANNTWFTRIWVVQEYLLARSVRVFFGAVSMPYSVIQRAGLSRVDHAAKRCCNILPNLMFLYHLDNFTGHFAKMHIPKPSATSKPFYDISTSSLRHEIFFLCLTYSSRLATEPLDKVYGIMGLAKSLKHCEHENEAATITPDYERPLSDLYLQVSKEFITKHSTLWPLMWSRLRNQCGGLPSWAVDWTSLAPPDQSKDFNTTESCATKLQGLQEHRLPEDLIPVSLDINNDNILITKGIELDEISDLGQTMESETPKDYASVRRSWEEMVSSKYKLESQYQSGDESELTWEDSIISALCSGRKPGLDGSMRALTKDDISWFKDVSSKLPDDIFETYDLKKGPNLIQKFSVFGGQQVLIQMQYVRFMTYIFQRTKGRRLFLTQKGSIGMVNSEVEVGDKIILLLGGTRPIHVVMRRLQEKGTNLATEKTYKVVGEAYVVGMMSIDCSKFAESDLEMLAIV